MLAKFKAAKFEFRIFPQEEISLPRYKGATFRGGFGYAFKKVVCSVRAKQCLECLLKDKCVYSYIFETPLPEGARMMRKYLQAPHPFVIEPPMEGRNYYPAGEEMIFNLVLIGKAIEYLPYFVLTFEELGRMGLGRNRGRYALGDVYSVELKGCRKKIYSAGTQKLSARLSPVTFRKIRAFAKGLPADNLTLEFLTPVRIKFGGALTSEITFDIIIRNLLRRISALSYFHCGEEMKADFRGIIERAGQIKVDNVRIKWYDWERYSTRQESSMKLGGVIGSMSFSGDIEEHLPLLKLGELIHIGKGTTFGLGKYRIMKGGLTET